MKNVREAVAVVLLSTGCLSLFPGCGTVKSAVSVVPGASLVPGLKDDESSGPKAGEKLHFKISPDEAVTILGEVAPQHGWELTGTGEQYDLQGLRGTFFRLETTRFIGGADEMTGVFFIEPSGTYVIVGSRHTGLPEDLVSPFTAAVEAKTGSAKIP